MNEIKIINKDIAFSQKTFCVEFELNSKIFEISITENYHLNGDFFDVDWDFCDGDSEYSDEEVDFIDDWVKSFKYEDENENL
jgi:hypothetical protein